MDKTKTEQINKSCRLCMQMIPDAASICFNCGQHQHFFVRHLHHGELLVAIIMMLIGYAQFKEAQKERTDAKVALEKARTIEKRINDSGIALSKALLALSRFDGTFGSLEIMPYSAPYLKKQADELINVLNITPEQKSEIFRHYEISGRLLEAFEDESEKRKIIEELKLLNLGKEP